MSEIIPSLDSIIVKGKFKVPIPSFELIVKAIERSLGSEWYIYERLGNTVVFEIDFKIHSTLEKTEEQFNRRVDGLRKMRSGIPAKLNVLVIECLEDAMILEVECKPVMYFKMTQLHEYKYHESKVQEAHIECKQFIRNLFIGGLNALEIEPVSVYPAIRRSEVKSKLENLGLEEVSRFLDDAETSITQKRYTHALTDSRKAFEKMITYQMTKHNLETTNMTRNDIERLASKGFLDRDTADLFKAFYHYLSNVGVHEKGAKPGLFEAKMGYNYVIVTLEYFLSKFY